MLRTALRYDLPASLVVFLVALPLSLGIAVASGAPVLAGVIAAVVGGIVAGACGGSPLQVSGPAAGLTVIVAGLVAEFGWLVTCAITVCAGILQVLFGLSRIARAALAISPVVVHAMLAGIGVTIALQQVHVLLGGSSHSSALTNLTELPVQIAAAHGPGLLLGVVVIVILSSWRWMPHRLRKVPGPLVAIAGVTVLSVVFPFDISRITLDGSLLDAIALPALPDGHWGAFATGVLTVALIASVESLLSAVSVDRMSTGSRTNFDRELIGQGAANIASGVIGGLPVTGVIVRSSTNVEAGAKTRVSAILHGVWILIFAVPFAGLVQLIPTSALAGLLIVVGIQLVKLAHIGTARRTGDLSIYLITIICVVFLNLLEGVVIGLVLAIALTVWRVVRTKMVVEEVSENHWRVDIEGSCTFLSLPKLTRTLSLMPRCSQVTIELSVDFLDHAFYETIAAWQRQHEADGGGVHIHDLGATTMESALSGPPTREFILFDKRSGVLPWKTWQRKPAPSVQQGLAVYQRKTAPLLRPHLSQLADSQSPETLFITCTDSRVVPNVITSSGPGDLFTVRNVGNMIPADQADVAAEAAIAFAIDQLRVSSIVICGHSSCGAMRTLLGGNAENEHVRSWLEHGAPALDAFRDGRHPVAQSATQTHFNPADQLSIMNIAMQMQTVSRHPLVVDRRIDVMGVFYDIASGDVLRVTATGVESFVMQGATNEIVAT